MLNTTRAEIGARLLGEIGDDPSRFTTTPGSAPMRARSCLSGGALAAVPDQIETADSQRSGKEGDEYGPVHATLTRGR
ncbi:hypothetical protein CFP75_20580 [Amycolatopsis alba DSM 44262]|uniref:Uncharacterized protein n=1 Tax=Amycolatopsis alba DSM 44262 TaxID=1125972 RepID=A0A229RQD4_AMYAL|nr:hypothetical protein CFP75_20580 [Amycolatopsis alba DSM 44262]